MYVNFPSFFLVIKLKLTLFYRAETPPNTPQRARIAAQQLDRSNRTLDSPQRHRTPHQANPPHIPPLRFNGPPPPPPPPLPLVAIPEDDPFAVPASVVPGHGPVHFNGHQYQHLPQHLTDALRNVHPEPPARRGRGRGRGRGQGHIPPVPPVPLAPPRGRGQGHVHAPQFRHLPQNLAQDYAALPPLLQPLRRQAPSPPPVCCFSIETV